MKCKLCIVVDNKLPVFIPECFIKSGNKPDFLSKLGVFMIFNIKTIDNTSIIYIHAKKFSLSECLPIGKTIIKLAKLGTRHIVLNLNYSLTVNNLFTEMLLFSWKFCDNNNCIISLCGMNPDTLCIFYLLKLDKYFEIYDNPHEAILRENRLIKRRLKAV